MYDQKIGDVNLNDLRESVLRRLPHGASQDSIRRVQVYRATHCIVRPGFAEIPFRAGDMWSDESDRAQSRYLHGFLFLGDWATSVRQDKSGNLAIVAFSMIAEWYARYSSRETSNKMAYHDETTAQRMISLLSIYESIVPHLSADKVEFLENLLDETAVILEDDDFHSTGNNHGMFQDVALINYAVLASWRTRPVRMDLFDLGDKRVRKYFSQCFTVEGVHRENTPTYHLMICRHLKSHCDLLRTINHSDADVLKEMLDKASTFATHSIMPSGKFPPVSDTSQTNLAWHAQNLFDDPEFEFAASGGRFGNIPKSRILALPESGYMMYRSSWTDPNATFVYFHAAYNADYHKHSDDLSLLVTSGGVDLITEAGPHGYNYEHPATLFAYGQYAHNNIVVNRRSVRRTDDRADTVQMSVDHDADVLLSVVGTTERLHQTKHRRTVNINEVDGESVIDVIDDVESETPSHFDMVWNLGPEVVPVVHGQGFELFHKGVKVMDAMMTSDVPLTISLHHGSTNPVRVGWRCPSFGAVEANNAIVLSFDGVRAKVETKFRLKSFNYTDRGLLELESGWKSYQGKTNVNYSIVPANDVSGSRKLVVVFSAMSGIGDFTYNYRSSLKNVPAHVLHILDDFGDQGSYYYSDHGDRYIFEATQELIGLKLAELGLGPDSLIMAGSSKGGTAALIHGIAAHAKDVFVGAPQTRIGSFLSGPHQNVLRFMTGGTTDGDVETLDRLLFDLVENNPNLPNISILVGDADHHYRNHVLPFVGHLKSLSAQISLDVRPGLPHSEIGPIYGRELHRFVSSSQSTPGESALSVDLSGVTAAPEATVTSMDSQSCVIISFSDIEDHEVALKLFREREAIDMTPYSKTGQYRWPDLPAGRYRVRVFARRTDDPSSRHAFTTEWVSIT